jgi:hypothetical protein
MWGGREDTNGQHNTFGRLSWVSHIPAGPQFIEFPISQIFLYDYFVTGEDDKAIFFIPGNTGTY